ncbi:MAG TPA: hypothetical protein VG168_01080 [Bryobacteraceae bacterium]|nr:hypothetical protein [Bryobacteraceae bacterium]
MPGEVAPAWLGPANDELGGEDESAAESGNLAHIDVLSAYGKPAGQKRGAVIRPRSASREPTGRGVDELG